MRILFTLILILCIRGPAAAAAAIQRVDVMPETEGTLPAGDLAFEFQLFDHSQQKNLSDQDLALSTDHKLDLVAFDAGLSTFTHVIPEFKAGRWSAILHLTRSGQYQIWVAGVIVSDSSKFQSVERTLVEGGAPASPAPPHLLDTRSAISGASTLTLSATKIRAEQTALLLASVSRANADEALRSSTPAFALAVSTSGQDVRFLDVTPGADADHFGVSVNLPKPSVYRLWIAADSGIFELAVLANR